MKLARFAANGQVISGRYERDQLIGPGGETYDPADVTWLPPVAHYDKAIGLALNYADHAAELTDELGRTINPDGVLFSKVWNGHAVQLRTQIDDMPAFKDKLTREEVWTLVEYLKVRRTPK
mgnify:CR=1 FL=1